MDSTFVNRVTNVAKSPLAQLQLGDSFLDTYTERAPKVNPKYTFS